MSTPTGSVRSRKKGRPTTPLPDSPNGSPATDADVKVHSKKIFNAKVDAPAGARDSSELYYYFAFGFITVLAFATRFYAISFPDQVVFDEVHFGKFASHYLQRTYFFDVHPPFGKLLFALAGWFVGYDGDFLFDNIGDSYTSNNVPYIAYRSVPALMGSLTVSTVFLIMWESGYSLPACLLATGLVLLDNAHVGQTRLILLDATLVFAMALSVLCYIRFYKLRHAPFSRKWWKWLLITGLALSCVISTKYVGAFTFFSIGVPVMIDLWGLLDINRRGGALTLPEFGRHFSARVVGLIVVPFMMYLFWFQVHFIILNRSGPGDEFMSPDFQETLGDNVMLAQSVGVEYWDTVTVRHKETRVYLHSHDQFYPLRYDDGRISSQGQQVTGYVHNDTNNQWQVLPTRHLDAPTGNPVRNGDIVQLRHIATDTYLRSHDVASPYYPTNQEFTTAGPEESQTTAFNDTLFELRVERAKERAGVRTKASHIKFIHYPSRVAMWTHTKPLPDWGFKQAEVCGNKNVGQSANVWYFEDLPALPADSPRKVPETRKVKTLPFLTKYIELQRLMFYHNNALTSSHPYSSHPVQWPFLLRGVSFWTNSETRQQIYFLGNPLGWWLASSLLFVLSGLLLADQVSLRRGSDVLDERTRSRLYNSSGFFLLLWAAHYVPFYVMGRQLFLHHYLPAHLASSLVAGALLEFIFNVEPTSATGGVADALDPKTSGALTTEGSASRRDARVPIRQRIGGQNLTASWIAMSLILAAVLAGFLFWAPLTYGFPGLSVPQILSRKWIGYDLHFAK